MWFNHFRQQKSAIAIAAAHLFLVPAPFAAQLSIETPSKLENYYSSPAGPVLRPGDPRDQLEPKPDGRIFFGSEAFGVFNSDLSQFSPFGAVLVGAPFVFDSSGRVIARRTQDAEDPVFLPVVVRLLSDGTVDPSFSAPVANSSNRETVSAIAIQADGKILLGTEQLGSIEPPYWEGSSLHLLRLNPDGSKDITFQSPPLGGPVRDIQLLEDGRIVASGEFSISFGGGTGTAGVARLNADGSIDQTFHASINQIYAMRLLPDGKILVGGDFNLNAGLARLHPNGQTDTSFVSGPAPSIRTLALQTDGRFLASGELTVARYFENGSIDRSFVARGESDILEARPTFGLAIGAGGRIFVTGESRVFRYSGQLRILAPASETPQILERSEFPDTGWFAVQNIPANTPIDYVQIGYPSPINAFYRARPTQ